MVENLDDRYEWYEHLPVAEGLVLHTRNKMEGLNVKGFPVIVSPWLTVRSISSRSTLGCLDHFFVFTSVRG